MLSMGERGRGDWNHGDHDHDHDGNGDYIDHIGENEHGSLL